ncbi:hypothetical protein LCGC14_0817250 [marine sediment metagenome]|uniref:Uncharacterized protein n=1 Tax=marine sediment metagenome TaxID=412755 RepID=A0A0F9PPL3_9ZZZZ
MNASRLLQLAEHLETGELGHEKFFFGSFTAGERNPDRYNCGTVGCAIGECPAVWPGEWEFKNLMPVLRDAGELEDSLNCAERFFDINGPEMLALFCPGEGLSCIPPIGSDATRHEVAARIRAFVRWKEEQ